MEIKKEKTVIIIAGATASGKTSLAIEIAKKLHTEIISADSRQCYRELSIGVARPSEEELIEVPHHFIATHSIKEKVTAAIFEKYALEVSNDLFKKHDVIIMTGGTGLYIKTFCEGIDAIPEIPETIRTDINNLYKQNGLIWLQNELMNTDPEYYRAGEIQNPQRMIRALEIMKATGKSILSFRSNSKQERPFNIIKYVIDIPNPKLHEQINHRVDEMIRNGLEEEVKSLIPFRQLPALQTVGYKELFNYFDGEITRDEAILQIKQNTRQYAKRQLTWFRKDQEFEWHQPFEIELECLKGE